MTYISTETEITERGRERMGEKKGKKKKRKRKKKREDSITVFSYPRRGYESPPTGRILVRFVLRDTGRRKRARRSERVGGEGKGNRMCALGGDKNRRAASDIVQRQPA